MAKTGNSLGSRDCVKPHHSQPIKPPNEEECVQGTAQLNCDPRAGRHIAMENYRNLKIRYNLILIDSSGRMTQENSVLNVISFRLFFLIFSANTLVYW